MDDDEGTKLPKRSLTPPPILDSLEDEVEKELASEMKSFDDFSKGDQKRVETVLRFQTREKIICKREREYFRSKAEYFRSKAEGFRSEKECYEKVLRIISVRSKLENFVDKNYPLRINSKTSETVYGKPDSSYCDALNEMLVSQDARFTQDVFIVMIRKRLDDRNITPAVFMKFARWLYNQMSDKACHKMAQFSPPLPKFDDDGAIKEMLKAVEIDEDDPAVICIQIILQPLDLPPIVTGTTP